MQTVIGNAFNLDDLIMQAVPDALNRSRVMHVLSHPYDEPLPISPNKNEPTWKKWLPVGLSLGCYITSAGVAGAKTIFGTFAILQLVHHGLWELIPKLGIDAGFHIMYFVDVVQLLLDGVGLLIVWLFDSLIGSLLDSYSTDESDEY